MKNLFRYRTAEVYATKSPVSSNTVFEKIETTI